MVFLNYLSEIGEFGNYSSVSSCITSPTLEKCTNIKALISKIYTIVIVSLRNHQDRILRIMESDILSKARTSEIWQYVVVAICFFCVIVSIVLFIPFFNWIIKDKSNVMTIFAYIEREEIQTIIAEIKKLDIPNIKFKKQWAKHFSGTAEMFWKKILIINHQIPSSNITRKEPEVFSKFFVPDQEGIERNTEKQNSEKFVEDPPVQHQIISPESHIFSAQEDKLKKRMEQLSEIDTTLRNRSIFRLLMVLFMFSIYVVSGFASTYYVHDINDEAVKIFLSLNKRNVYLSTMNLILKHAIETGNKEMIVENSENNGVLYMIDIMNEMLKIEAQITEFLKHASTFIYGNYLSLSSRADSADFCAVSDCYNSSQTTPCKTYYVGPSDQGLSVGISFLIDLHTQYTIKVQNTNFSNTEEATELQADTVLEKYNSNMTQYISSVMEYLVVTFYEDIKDFFNFFKLLLIGIVIGFSIIFSVIYILIFFNFASTLKDEIWQTHGILKMIPRSLLKKNQKVRALVYDRKGIKQFTF